ncbi:MAG: thiol reductant ABC exporter subunit CydC [Gracilibacteraceae bacterium]|nr:thiol reductant ABC exporter subunit CydC [Gracilibacteraceae bacterium]
MAKLILLVGPLKGFLALAVLLGALGNIAAAAIPVLGVWALLTAAGAGSCPAPPEWTPAVFVSLAFLAGLSRGVFRYGEQTLNHYIAFKLLALIREKLFAALRRLCPAKLEGKEKGDLIAVLTSDIELLEVFYAHTLSPAAIALLTTVAAAGLAWLSHPLFALIVLTAHIAVGAALPVSASRFTREEQRRLREESGRFSAFYLDSLRGLPELLEYGGAEARKREIGRRTDEMDAARRRLNRREGATGAVAGLLVTAFTLLALAAACLLYGQGRIAAGAAVLPVVLIFSSFGPALALSALGSALPGVLAAGRRVLALLEEDPETPEVTNGEDPDFSGAESRNLSFSYGGEEVLRDISISLEKGLITGITGRSGSGKSTFLKLLMRFWRSPENTVFISGAEIGRINTGRLRELESFMTQETYLFHTTIGENILIGRPGASRADMIAAAKKAALHDFVQSLPEGYDTPVGEMGCTLSSGERQRVGLARAFLHDAPLLLLDEPTSNLDSLNEGVILKALREEKSGRAVALVSHRPSTMGAADTVYLLGGG